MKVEINGKTYCVETLIADNERLRKEIIESANTIRLVLDSIRTEIEQIAYPSVTIYRILDIIDKYRVERNK